MRPAESGIVRLDPGGDEEGRPIRRMLLVRLCQFMRVEQLLQVVGGPVKAHMVSINHQCRPTLRQRVLQTPCNIVDQRQTRRRVQLP